MDRCRTPNLSYERGATRHSKGVNTRFFFRQPSWNAIPFVIESFFLRVPGSAVGGELEQREKKPWSFDVYGYGI